MGVPVPRGTLLLPTACSAELSQLLQTLSAAEEVTSSGGWKNKENSAIRGKAFLSALSLHTGGATGTSHHQGNHCPFMLQTYSPLLVLTQLKF